MREFVILAKTAHCCSKSSKLHLDQMIWLGPGPGQLVDDFAKKLSTFGQILEKKMHIFCLFNPLINDLKLLNAERNNLRTCFYYKINVDIIE